MSEFAILLARVSSISKYSTSLLKWLLQIPASSSSLLIFLLLLFKKMDALWKALQEDSTDSFSKFSIVGDNSVA